MGGFLHLDTGISIQIGLFKFPVIQQRCNQDHKAGACVVNQCAGGGIQHTQNRQGHGHQVDAHGQADAELDGIHRGSCYKGFV